MVPTNKEKTKLHSAQICWIYNAKGSSSQTHLAKQENGQFFPPGAVLGNENESARKTRKSLALFIQLIQTQATSYRN